MAILAIEVPHQTARLFSEIDVPGTREALSSMHITLIYVGPEIAIDVLAEVVKAAYVVTSKTRPFTVQTTRVMSFSNNPDHEEGYPIIARIESDELHDLRTRLARALDRAGIDFDQKFPNFKPHVTLAYAAEAVEEFTIPTIEWGAHEAVLWGGEEGDSRLKVTFPFALKPSKRAPVTALTERVVERFRTAAAFRERRSTPG